MMGNSSSKSMTLGVTVYAAVRATVDIRSRIEMAIFWQMVELLEMENRN